MEGRKAQEEHPDTPMRKRPRLDSEAEEDFKSVVGQMSVSAKDDADPTNDDREGGAVPLDTNSPTQQLSSEVTLNVRSADSSPKKIEITLEPVSATSAQPDRVPSSRSSSRTPDFVVIEQDAHFDDDVVAVDIELDDPEDTKAGRVTEKSTLDNPEAMLKFCEELLDGFPPCNQNQYTIGDHVAGWGMEATKEVVRLDLLMSLSDWVHEHWLAHLPTFQPVASQIYGERRAFWDRLAEVYRKLLNNRNIRKVHSPKKPSDDERSDPLGAFFQPFMQLCASFFAADNDVLAAASKSTSESPALVSSRYLSTLYLLLRPVGAPFWMYLDRLQGLDVIEARRGLAMRLVANVPEMISYLTSLAWKLLVEPSLQPRFGQELVHCFGIIRWLSHDLAIVNCTKNQTAGTVLGYGLDVDALERLANEIISFTKKVFDHIVSCPTNQLPKVQPDQFTTIVDTVQSIVADLQYLEPSDADRFLQNFKPLDPVLSEWRYSMATNCVKFSLTWALVLKGRMELRVLSVNLFSDRLKLFYQETGQLPSNFTLVLRSVVADWMARQKVIENICSVDSHPQLISRSSDILGFLLVTDKWSAAMSDAVWGLLMNNPDRRMCAAMWENLSKAIRYAQKDVLSHICQRLAQLLPSHYVGEMLSFLGSFAEALSDKLVRGDYPLDDSLENPLLPFKKLICDTVSVAIEDTDETVLLSVHTACLTWLPQLAERARSDLLRRDFYAGCVEDIRQGTVVTLGSVECIIALLNGHPTDDTDFLVDKLGLLDAAISDFCRFVGNLESAMRSSGAPHGLDARLKLCTELCSSESGLEASPELVARFIAHAVGQQACNNQSRDLAWGYFLNAFTKSRIETPVMARLLQDFVPDMAPETFTSGFLAFIINSIASFENSQDWSQMGEVATVDIPLIDQIWRIMLCAPQGTIEEQAVLDLGQLYVVSEWIKAAPHTNVSATHVAVIERCMKQLEEAATVMSRTPCEAPDVEIAFPSQFSGLSSGSGTTATLQFTRTLLFLRHFVNRLKTETWPWLRDEGGASSSPTASSADGSDNEVVELLYQTFGAGSPKDVKHLQIGAQATFATLRDRLQEKTGFKGISLFHGGRRVKFEGRLSEPIDSIVGKGLLLVRSDDQKMMEAVPQKPHGLTTAEKAVIAHLDELCHFLTLDDERLSAAVYEFLLLFPPHNHIREAVLDVDVDLGTLFPLHHRFKAYYSLWSLKCLLLRHTASNTMTDTFLTKTVFLLSKALTTPPLAMSSGRSVSDERLIMSLVECLSLYLRERPVVRDVNGYIENGETLVATLFALLENRSGAGSNSEMDMLTVYRCLLEAVSVDQKHNIWNAFRELPKLEELHQWLVLEQEPRQRREECGNLIMNTCSQDEASTGMAPAGLAAFYWKILSRLVPAATTQSHRSRELFDILASILSTHSSAILDETALRDLLSSWTIMLSGYNHIEYPGQSQVDYTVGGLLRLMSLCITSLRSFKKPIGGQALVELLLDRYLFPMFASEDTDAASRIPILDVESRKKAYGIVTTLSEDSQCNEWLVKRLLSLTDVEAEVPGPFYAVDRDRWLRSSVGYSGLRNLTNTCYMNSLMAQLFLNSGFRAFMLSVDTSAHQMGTLVAETQKLFAIMQNGQERFADTSKFTQAIRPYEEEHIDVSIQMDVDEFYNLLLDRWETEMKDPETKQKLRSFYGGQLVSQIKSRNCEHVSERVEPFFTISCDVRGKKGLADSLKAYVEGEVMEGDNKYKCESCDGRFVDAVKRSCLKDLPNNLIFSLKRFDFDLTTLLRSKINDYFTFPEEIDMTPYTVEYVNEPTAECSPDVFRLVGVLVHTGTAETGHYYSYINVPAMAADPTTAETWAEFNDVEVSEFDKKKIPDQCFGGDAEVNGAVFPKVNNAYMLFYKRASAIESELFENRLSTHAGPAAHSIPEEVAMEINDANQRLLLRYCLFDTSHASFVKRIVSDMRSRTGGACSEAHDMEQLILEMALRHATLVFARVKGAPDHEALLEAISKQTECCAKCCAAVLDWIIDNPDRMEEVMLGCPELLVRMSWSDFIPNLLKQQRMHDESAYGIAVSTGVRAEGASYAQDLVPLPLDSSLFRIVTMLKRQIPKLGRYVKSWNEFFGTVSGIADLGSLEAAILLHEAFLVDILEIVRLDRQRKASNMRYAEIYQAVAGARNPKTPQGFGIIRCLSDLLGYVDPCAVAYKRSARLRAFDEATELFPPTLEESELLHETTESQNNQLVFLTRMIDLWEDIECQPYHPQAIMKHLIMCAAGDVADEVDEELGPDPEFELCIGDTVEEAVREYEFPWLKTPFRIALTFCLHSGNKEKIQEIMTSASKAVSNGLINSGLPKVNIMNQLMDYDDRCGADILGFWTSLATAHIADETSEPSAHDLAQDTVELVPAWATGLLLFMPYSIRRATAQALDDLIFARYPDHLSTIEADEASDDATPEPFSQPATALDEARIVAVRELYRQCLKYLNRAEALRLPRRFVYELGSVMAQCASWCHKLSMEDAGPLAALKETIDDEIVQSFAQRGALDNWHQDFDIDEAATETEWDSDNPDSDVETQAA